ncbi:leucine-rich repeat protein, partial [Finegoldia magna]|uniref:leucine-rich repeat protein n=1 Tax=Finegoldia magna TaxID=1260 RepID=UPI0029104999
MKKFNTNRLRAFFMALLLVLTSTVHTNAFAKSDVTWTEDDFIYHQGDKTHVAGLSKTGWEKAEKTQEIKFLEGTKTIGYINSSGYSQNMFDIPRISKLKDLKITLPESLETIKSNSFVYCPIREIKLPSNLKTIESWAFNNTNLEEIYIPDSVTNLGGAAFRENKIKRARLPKGLKVIKDGLFFENELEEIEIPDSVEVIEGGAFYKNALRRINAPSNPKLNNTGAKLIGNQVVEYRPKQNPFYLNNLGYNGELGISNYKNLIKDEDGGLIFPKDVDMVELDFSVPKYYYSGTIKIYNPNKYSVDTQTDLTGKDIDEKDNKIDDLTKNIKDLENQIKDLNDKKQEDQSKIDELKEKLESCKDNGEKLKQEKSKLEEEIRDKDNKIAQLNKEIEELKNSNNDELIAEITQLKDELKRLQDENAKLKEDYSSTK